MNNNFFYSAILMLFFNCLSNSQTLAGYNFSSDTGTFTPLTSANVVWSSGDDVTASSLPIGFNFSYGLPNPTIYSQFCLNSNGWLGLTSNTIPNLTSNSTPNITSTSYPRIAPLWDDLSIGSGGKISYLTSGNVGDRVLTVEWLKMKWYWGVSSPVISFQIKLYESSGNIEFIYQQESGAPSNNNASIGINNASATDFWCVKADLSNAIYGTNCNTIITKPSTGRIFRWATSILNINALNILNTNFFAYPNPFSNEIYLNLNAIDENIISVDIFDLNGKKVYHKINSKNELSNIYRIDNNFNKGVYLIKISTKNKEYVLKTIKN